MIYHDVVGLDIPVYNLHCLMTIVYGFKHVDEIELDILGLEPDLFIVLRSIFVLTLLFEALV